MAELAPGWDLTVEHASPHHWVGSCGDVVLVFTYEGSHDDDEHVRAAVRVVERVASRAGKPAFLLFALPIKNGKAPSVKVRSAVLAAVGRIGSRLGHVAVVVTGEGFAAAMHRSVVTGILLVTSAQLPYQVRVEPSVRAALVSLIGPSGPAYAPLLRLCEQRIAGPSA